MASLTTGVSCRKHDPPAPGDGVDDPPGAQAPELPPYRVFDSATAALDAVLDTRPRVLAIGELHQTTDTVHVASALQRFTGAMLEALAPSLSDLIVETWVQDGACGPQEEQVGGDIQAVTRRPPETEDQVMTLLARARRLGVEPHVLAMRCEDYQALLGDAGEVDYELLLALVTRELRNTTARVLARRDRDAHDAGAAGHAGARTVIAVYGGSLHNNLQPHPALAEFSYARELARQSGDRLTELDLYVPEFAQDNPLLVHEPWYPLLDRLAGPQGAGGGAAGDGGGGTPDRVALIERGPRSFILLLPRSPPAPPAADRGDRGRGDQLPTPPATR